MLVNPVLFLVLSTASNVFASPAPSRTIQKRAPSLQGRDDYAELAARANTNAKRLALGLPLLRPKFKREGEIAPPKPSSTPPSGIKHGQIYVTKRDTKEGLGYIAVELRNGAYGLVAGGTTEQRLRVSIDLRKGHDNQGLRGIGLFNVGAKQYQFLGGITSPWNADPGDSLATGNSNHAYLGGMGATPAHAPAIQGDNSYKDVTRTQSFIESGIFQVDETGVITVHWINNDGSASAAQFLYNAASNLLLIGDPNNHPEGAEPATFTFVPEVSK